MKVRAIRLENVRQFIDPVEIGAIGDGLNVLTAPNERGKSTFFDALHAVFFKDRKAWDRDIRALVPHAGGDPSVMVEIELPDGVFRIEKRWNKGRRGDVRILSDGRVIRQADDAQAWIAEILKSPKDGGPAGLLWVRQGQSGLDEGEATQRARRGLLTSVAGEVEAMTGGRRMDRARDLCRKERDRYLTEKGRLKAGGPLKRAQDAVVSLQEEREELEQRSGELRRELDRRRELRRELADLDGPEAEETRANRLSEAQAIHAEALRHHEMLEQARQRELAKGAERDREAERLAALERNLAERKAARAAFSVAQEGERAAMADAQAAESEMSEAAARHETARLAADAAAKTLQMTLRTAASRSGEERRTEFRGLLKRAEELRQRAEQAAAKAKVEILEDGLSALEKLGEDLRVLKRTRDTDAAAVTMAYVGGRTGGVSMDGVGLPDRERVPIPDGAKLEIDRLGQLDISPGRKATDESVAQAEAALAAALENAGFRTLAEARESARRRRSAEERRRDADAELAGVVPRGIEALRAQIAALPEPVEAPDDLPSIEEAQERDTAARKALADASGRWNARRGASEQVQKQAARAAAVLEGAEGRQARAETLLAEFEDPEAERSRLETVVSELTTAHGEAMQASKALAAKAPDLEAAGAALDRARSVVQGADQDRHRIRVELSRLDAAIDIRAGEAVEEELADAVIRLDDAKRTLDELEFEVAVLTRLEDALEEARTSARDRYVEPVLSELAPLVRLLWPEAELRFDAEDVLPAALERAGTEEQFAVLSGGTQEQIAVLVRLAFARMLARGGAPAPVIFDDAIVFTDDDRIERMFDALTRQAQDLQIIVLSCRQRAFRELGGRRLEIVSTVNGS